MTHHDMTFMRDEIIKRFGPEARPSGAIRMLSCGSQARLQMEFISEVGAGWLDVPIIKVDVMPEKCFPDEKPALSRAARRVHNH